MHMAEDENAIILNDTVKNLASMSIDSSSSNTVKGEYFSVREDSFGTDRSAKGESFSAIEGNVLSDQGILSNRILAKAKFMCSSGGKILPRPLDMKLRYVGGENRMISVPRNITYADFLGKMVDIYGPDIVLRYQLPDEDLDALVSVSSDEDLDNMMEECDRLHSAELSSRLRVFVFHEYEADVIDLQDILDPKISEQKFVDAINAMSFDLPSREANRSQFAEFYLNNSTASFNPWDAIQRRDRNAALHQETETFPLDVHISSENFHMMNAISSAVELSHPVSMSPLDEILGESTSMTNIPRENEGTYSSENGGDDFYDLEYGSFKSLPVSSSQQKILHKEYAENDLYQRSQTQNIVKPNDENGCGQDMDISRHFGLQEDLKNLESEDHHQNTDSRWQGSVMELNVGHLNANLVPDIDLLTEFQEECYQAEDTYSVIVSEFSSLGQFPLNLGPHNKVIHNQTLDEENAFQERGEYEESSSAFAQKAKLVSIISSNYMHEQALISPIPQGNSAKEFPTSLMLTPEECNVEINLELVRGHVPVHDKTLISYPYTLDSVGVPQSTNSGRLNQGVKQEDEGYYMHQASLDAVNTTSYLFPSLDGVLEDDFLYQSVQQDRVEKVSGAFDLYQSDPEVLSRRNNSPGISLAEECSVQEESNTHGFTRHNQEALTSSTMYLSPPLDIISDLLSSLPPENPKLGSLPSQPLHLLDDYPHQEGDSLTAREAAKEVHTEDLYHHQSSEKRESEDPTFHSIQNSLASNEQFGRVSTAFKSTFNNGTVLDEDSLPKARESENISALRAVNSLAFASLIETWEASLLRDDEHMQNAAVLDVVHEEARDIDTVEESGVELEEHDDFQSFDFGPRNVATIAEEEATARGLQTIRNCDLEDLRELGSGTFGTVYHGKWRGSDVAIKRIKASCFAGRKNERDRLMADFWREACLLSQLHHPNVVAFYGVVPDGPGGTFATVTEYMVNGSLKQVLQRKDRTLDRRKRLLIAMDAAFGMEYLHGKNVVHFDIKCENLLVNMRDIQRPICKVGDLGLSKVKQQTFVSGGVRGTLPWMAPELLNGSSSLVSEKVDVFSFGIVMWELITGEEPYANMHYGAIIGGIVNNTLRPTIPRSCDPAWRSLMEKCWAADAAGRPTFSEIARSLRAMEASLNVKGQSQTLIF